ncbi:MAG: hypothetical protein ACRC33_05865 [Gemmataceae bacterium]
MPFAIAGQAGSVILFVCAGVGLVVVGSYFVAFAARCYLVVVQGTAVGLDAVEWPDESPVDWIGQSAVVLFQLALWIMPAGFLARALATTWLPGDPPLRFFMLMGAAAWLLFPVGFLLSMASSYAGGAAARLLTSLPTLAGFYALTAGLLVGGLGLCYLGVFTPAWYALPVAAVLGPALLLIHARLVGRLGWLIGRRELTPGKPKKRKKRRRVPTQSRDPWAVPEDDDLLPVEADEAEPEKEARPSYMDPEPDPYTVEDFQGEAPPPTKVEIEGHQIEREMKLRRREEAKPPKSLFFSGVWEFPLYPTTHKPWVWLTLLALGAGGIARFMVSVSPFGGG